MNYRQHKGLGSTDIKNLLVLPEIFYEKKYHGSESSASMAAGTVIHSYLLEHDTFDATHNILPHDFTRRTNVSKEVVRLAAETGTTLVNASFVPVLEKLKLEFDKILIEIAEETDITIEDFIYEKEYYATCKYPISDEEDAEKCKIHLKAKPDICVPRTSGKYGTPYSVIIDLKTIGLTEEFGNTRLFYRMKNYSVPLQLFHYKSIINSLNKDIDKFRYFVIVASQTDAPLVCKYFEVPSDKVEEESDKWHTALSIYAKCKGLNEDDLIEDFLSPLEMKVYKELEDSHFYPI